MTTKYIYSFEQGEASMKTLLGGKGANLAEMTRMGLLVPPGFIITTEACRHFLLKGEVPEGLFEEMEEHLREIEKRTEKRFGGESPLLLSVRSGAPVSMPGMMDTVLNLGLNDSTVEYLGKRAKDNRFAYDCYRRFIQMFGIVVLGLKHEVFEDILERVKKERGVKQDSELSAEDLKKAVKEFKEAITDSSHVLPEDPKEQLKMTVNAVFNSWNTPRAVKYRELNDIPDDMGTAVNVQVMVFGNIDPDSGTGVVFTRNPSTGEKRLYGEFLMCAQGEDVVAGIRTPKDIKEMEKELQNIYVQLSYVASQLEKHYKEMQDIEFTIESGQLYILQTRSGKRTALATVKIAVDMAKENLLTKEEAVLKVGPEHIEQLLHKRIDPKAKLQRIAKGLNASPGAASGKVIFETAVAAELGKKGEKIILVREETTPDDIHGIALAQGILTARGGMTSHAAVVARGMGKPCVCGCESIRIDEASRQFVVGNVIVKEGDVLTIDGTNGEVILGDVPLIEPDITDELKELLSWADELRRLKVMANADTPDGARNARKFGAEGIGLCRTERMFNAPDRLPIVRRMILAETEKERLRELELLLPIQKQDFKEILKVMEGLPVTIRLLDPPLHEFLQSGEELLRELAYLRDFREVLRTLEELPCTIRLLDPQVHEYLPPIEKMLKELSEIKEKEIDTNLLASKSETLRKVNALAEINPMLGHRGVRLGITYPEIYDMQIKAIFEAVAELVQEGVDIKPEIMVPQVCTAEELKWVHSRVERLKKETEEKYGVKLNVKFGTMIEVVRACMRAGKLAEIAEFFSFGTNDLTQATFSFSREDAEKKFLPLYTDRKILQDNPFEVLDIKGVGRLMTIAVEWGRKTRPDLKIGICGEHGGEPSAIHFCHKIGVDYVSCSPFRVPIARLAAAHAKLLERFEKPK